MTQHELASGCAGRDSPCLGEATDVSVAQAVVDEGEEFAGARDAADAVVASAVSDPVIVHGDRGCAALTADGFDRCPAHQT
jgi:hypothetical protein